MELVGIAQEVVRVLLPQPSGRPDVISATIRRSVVVSALAARNLRLHTLFFTLLGGLTIAFTLAKVALESSSLTSQHIGILPYVSLHLLYTLGLLIFLNPLLRKFRLLI